MGNPGKWFKLFIKDEQVRFRAFKTYINWKQIYCLGESEIGFLKSLTGFQSVAVYYLVAEQIAVKMGWHISMTGICILIPCWLVFKVCLYLGMGIFWDKNKFVQISQEWGNKRNPMLQNIENSVSKNLKSHKEII